MRGKSLWKALIGAMAALLFVVLLGGGILLQNASAQKGEGTFVDALNNGRAVYYEEPVEATLKVTDGDPSSTRMYYTQNVDTRDFRMTFTLNNFNVDGGLRISFLSSSGDYPMEKYGDGFGVYFWDETAWEYPANTSFRMDFYAYGKNPAIKNMTDGKAMRNSEENVEAGNTFDLRVWNWNDDNLAIEIKRNGGTTADRDMVIGTFAKANLPEGFDYTNCTLMITPEIDSSRPHSYEEDISLTIHSVSVKGEFADALNRDDRITLKKLPSRAILKFTDGQPSNTRLYYTQRLSVSDFTAEFTIDQFNVDGGLRVSFLNTQNDYPQQNYGDGFGIYMFEGKAWNPDDADKTHLALHAGVYGRETGITKLSDRQWMSVTEGNIVENQKFTLHVESDGDNLVLSVTRGEVADDNTPVSFTIAKADLPEGFDYTDCVLLITPDIDSTAGREHSYEKDIVLSSLSVDWRRERVAVTATKTGEGTVTVENGVTDVERGKTVTFTVEPAKLYEVGAVTLNGTAVELTDEGTYTATAGKEDLVFNVTFNKLPTATISASGNAGGNVTFAPNEEEVLIGTEITFKATVTEEFYEITAATLNGQAVELEEDGTYTATATENLAFAVTFAEIPLYTVSAETDGHGTVTSDPATEQVRRDVTVTFTIAPADGYLIDYATLNGERVALTGYTYQVAVKGNIEFAVVFKAVPMSAITVEAGEHGTVTANPAFNKVEQGSDVVFTVTPDKLYEVDTVKLNGTAVELEEDGTYTATASEDLVFEATFKKLPTATIQATSNEGGNVTFAPNEAEVLIGTEITFTVTITEEFYEITAVTLNGQAVELEEGGTYTATATENLTFAVTFAEIPLYTIETEKTGEGTITTDPDVTSLRRGGTVTFTAAPAKFYEITAATLNGEAVELEDGAYTATATANLVFKVTFSKVPTATVHATAGEGGSVKIEPNEEEVLLGTEITFTVTTSVINKVAYKVEQAYLNGVPVPLTDGKFVTLAGEDLDFEVVFEEYRIDPNSPFADYAFNPNRTDVDVQGNGNMIVSMTTKDNADSITRIYSKNAINLDSFSMKFTLDQLSVGGGLKIAFMLTNDDYPLDSYGTGFALWLYDDTAEGSAAFSSLHAVVTAHSRNAQAVLLGEGGGTSTGEESLLGAEVVLTVTYADGVIKLSLKVGDTDVFGELEIESDALPSFYANECYLMIGPSAQGSASSRQDTVITITELKMHELVDGGDDPDLEYSVTFICDGKIVKQDYTVAGDVFTNFTPAEKEGYTFDGWYTDEACTQKYDFSQEAESDLVLYGKYNQNEAPKQKKGCSGSAGSAAGIAAVAVALAAVAVCAVVFKKKHNG